MNLFEPAQNVVFKLEDNRDMLKIYLELLASQLRPFAEHIASLKVHRDCMDLHEDFFAFCEDAILDTDE